MAPRVRSQMSSDDFNTSYPESSPDPLAVSLNGTKPARQRRKSTRAPTAPLAPTSPNKQGRRSSVTEQTLEFSSPSKSMVMSTGRPGGASPWRIKVTVQAEPGSGSDHENTMSPTVGHVTRTQTKTVKVPLKDADESSPVKRRGRPKKSDTTATPKPKAKRSGTPLRKRSKSRNADVETRDFEITGGEIVVIPKKRRGRPRKSVQPEPEPEPEPAQEEASAGDRETQPEPDTVVANPAATGSEEPEVDLQEEMPAISSAGATPGVPKSQMTVPIIQTTSASPQEQQSRPRPTLKLKKASFISPTKPPVSDRRRRPAPEDHVEDTVSTPQKTDLSQKLRTRKATPAAKGKILLEDSSNDGDAEIHTPSGTDEEEPAVEQHEPGEVTWATAQHQDSAQIEAQEFLDSDDDDEQYNDMTMHGFDDGITKMPDDTTVLESENFSMVSVDSLPSGKGLSSPINEPPSATAAAEKSLSALSTSRLQIPSNASRNIRSSPLPPKQPSPGPSYPVLGPQSRSSPSAPVRRYRTPVEARSPSNPPAIVPAQFSPKKPDTPKLAKVVKAGIALQGLLDPIRTTPVAESSEKPPEKRKDRLDDLFRGFSDGTRRELQAGLRLGEQLARQSKSRSSSPAPTPSKVAISGSAQDDVFKTTKPTSKHRPSRLLTPEDQDDYTLPLPPASSGDVRYPSLKAADHYSHLVSPARSEDEMSWRVDTPPPGPSTSGQQRLLTDDERVEFLHGQSALTVRKEVEEEDYSDIWQVEASRSPEESPSGTDGAAEAGPKQSPQLQDLLSHDGSLIRPARAKIPKTWRRKSSSDFNYSDEAEPEAEEQEERAFTTAEKGKGKMAEPTIAEEEDYEDDGNYSEASDDTGMFFQSNLPSIFTKRRSATRLQDTRGGKVDLSLLLGEGESLLPESSPVVKTPQPPQLNPFKNTPPRFAALQASPAKSSPLRFEMRSPESEQNYEESMDRSILPPSSPFRTQVDDSMASDIQQLRHEMEGHTDSSIRHLREEADAHAYAYEPQDRTLEQIEEVTEHSRTRTTMVLPSSPPPVIEESILAPKRAYPPLFGEAKAAVPVRSPSRRSTHQHKNKPYERKIRQSIEIPPVADSVTPPVSEAPRQSGIFNRLTSSLWSALGTPAPPPPHPAGIKFSPLPKIEPWTKTHYKTLDALYQLHKKQPTLFAPSTSANTSNTNNALLTYFLSAPSNKQYPFVGARFNTWGYSVVITEPMIVLCAVFMQRLKLENIAEYERITGKDIEMGDCNPGESGTELDGLAVVTRLASVVMGEDLRRDEKRGMACRREGGLVIEWH
ncbi:hypothetical protein BCR34DRAFT_573197 [Clohesyomyces aquaticus]|uniref:Uncharacterized protein n=1 Tax=Clohesyomyces aquaticus TaxID=1231657 RepID=A0A1Y1Z0M3_9PLEO|nr:hypothetical protein BCR34DRAFT_573197 [Clohesyomyces aquaticus]